MPVEPFTEKQFRDALPIMTQPLGLIDGEYCYLLPVSRPGVPSNVAIFIRSSVRADGHSAASGSDSIRCWLVDRDRKPLGAKMQHHITRLPGWQERMLRTLRGLYKRGLQLIPCPACGLQTYIGRVQDKGKESFGRLYITCRCRGYFSWLTGEKEEDMRGKKDKAR